MNESIHFRPLSAEDINFFYNSWLVSYRNTLQNLAISNPIYYQTQKEVIHNCITNGDVIMACDPEDHNSLFGFICYEGNVVHYIYVKYPFRRLGVANELLKKAGIDTKDFMASHWSPAAQYYQKNHGTVTYDPTLKETSK